MELKIEYLPTGDLIPYARNSRTHTDEQVAQVAASIREFGFASPVLIGEDRTIIAGHCRVMAAQKLGLETVPTVTATGWTEAQRRAYPLVRIHAGRCEQSLRCNGLCRDVCAGVGKPDANDGRA